MAEEKNPYPHNEEARQRLAEAQPWPSQDHADRMRDPNYEQNRVEQEQRRLGAGGPATYQTRDIQAEGTRTVEAQPAQSTEQPQPEQPQPEQPKPEQPQEQPAPPAGRRKAKSTLAAETEEKKDE